MPPRVRAVVTFQRGTGVNPVTCPGPEEPPHLPNRRCGLFRGACRRSTRHMRRRKKILLTVFPINPLAAGAGLRRAKRQSAPGESLGHVNGGGCGSAFRQNDYSLQCYQRAQIICGIRRLDAVSVVSVENINNAICNVTAAIDAGLLRQWANRAPRTVGTVTW